MVNHALFAPSFWYSESYLSMEINLTHLSLLKFSFLSCSKSSFYFYYEKLWLLLLDLQLLGCVYLSVPARRPCLASLVVLVVNTEAQAGSKHRHSSVLPRLHNRRFTSLRPPVGSWTEPLGPWLNTFHTKYWKYDWLKFYPKLVYHAFCTDKYLEVGLAW